MKFKIKTFDVDHEQYPKFLKSIPNPPKKINILGELPNDPPAGMIKIAIVGTRKATKEGLIMAKNISSRLSEAGIIVVSGLAIGIDAAAHEGAVSAGGKTIAVLANGLDKIYPAQNANLAKKILSSGGAIISEYPEKTPPFPSQFLGRNRIISGLSSAVIVIEAPERSGSLATANWAAEQGREVFVIPGPVNHPNYRGSHNLIRDGARLISSAKDVLEDLGLENLKSKIPNPGQIKTVADKNQLSIIKTLEKSGRALVLDEIIKLTKLEPQTVNSAIAFLTIAEMIKETERGYTII